MHLESATVPASKKSNKVGVVVFGKLPTINGFEISLPVAVCSGIANALFNRTRCIDNPLIFSKPAAFNGFDASLPKPFALD